ncbi:hypothetical protein A3F37_02625 [Candidatus Saccharibacteria bacterium RIFCSPHIGHO2_12_FULL_41_12]|nr:MAG: hypothetical protein A3F37_02625 [Candidatus Saccharibacteria bacterium RIFCSPHIGHO2_12_FULL_41_12]
MPRINPEYLDRDEPFRVPVGDFRFISRKPTKAERREVLWQDGCLAEELGKVSGYNSASDVTSNNTTYGDKRLFEDGSTERLIGCSSCGAMCTIVTSPRKGTGPGTEEDPNNVLSVAEAPLPNPWMELGNFSDCKIGRVQVPEGANALTEPHGLSELQRVFVKISHGVAD